MKHLLKIYISLAGGILAITLVLITTLKLTSRNPIAPNAPTQQQAAETVILPDDLPKPLINNEEVGFKVRIAGLSSQGPDIVLANINIFPQNETKSFDALNVALQRGPNGNYFGKMISPQPAQIYVNTPVFVIIQGEKHLSRRFETTLQFGMYTDLTQKILEAGDLALPETNGQDGTIDNNDINYVKKNMLTNNTIADLNYDGIVNAGDMSLILDASE